MHCLKRILFILIVAMSVLATNAQPKLVDNLKYRLSNANSETDKAIILDSLSMYYMFYTNNHDSSFYYLNQYVDYTFNLKDKKYLVLAYARLGFYYFNTAQLNAALSISLKGLQVSDQYGINDYLATLYYNISFVYYNLGDSALSSQNAFKGVQALAYNKDPFYDIPLHLYGHISSIYAGGGNLDSALLFLHRMDAVVPASKERAARDISFFYWSVFYLDVEDYAKADSVIALGIASCEKSGDFLLKGFYLYRATSYIQQHKYKETIEAARIGMGLLDPRGALQAFRYMQASYYRLGKIDSAYYYLKAKDSIRSVLEDQSNIHETQQLQFDAQLGKKEAQANQVLQEEKSRNRQILYSFGTVLAFFIFFGLIQRRNNLQKKRANILLQQQKEKVEITLSELKSTQSQLIQSEKMASLGELTAGIAHEIQNPLNFVNNFSEINSELIDELSDEAGKGNIDEVINIANDIKENSAKINQHGKRADAIVKGMLQHSRKSNGHKEPTNINALADEYLRLAYHGLRAKDKEINATIKTEFDTGIGNINIIPQDIGRVLLNLYTNAFYAVNERKKAESSKLNAEGLNYEPTVTIITKLAGDHVEIRVQDNGSGIPDKIKDKIFQPFFTTKPTGQGTGLGLSLSYDIVKAHGGEIKVESKEGEGTTFIIIL